MAMPASLIIDDGACINLMHWLHIEGEHPLHIPVSFTQEFADFVPALWSEGEVQRAADADGTGRIDERLSYVPAAELEGFLRVVREEIAPSFDITPEILTHQAAFDLPSGRSLHLYEDEWFRTATVAQMTDYLVPGLPHPAQRGAGPHRRHLAVGHGDSSGTPLCRSDRAGLLSRHPAHLLLVFPALSRRQRAAPAVGRLAAARAPADGGDRARAHR